MFHPKLLLFGVEQLQVLLPSLVLFRLYRFSNFYLGVAGTIVKRNDASNNIWDFNGSNFIVKNIEFVGGSRGLRLGEQGNCANVLLQDLKVHETESTAVSFNDNGRDYNNITIRRVEVYNTGSDTSECFYTGTKVNIIYI